jgi:hypothetical protein
MFLLLLSGGGECLKVNKFFDAITWVIDICPAGIL